LTGPAADPIFLSTATNMHELCGGSEMKRHDMGIRQGGSNAFLSDLSAAQARECYNASSMEESAP
jgi:hypothetical protein